MADPERDDVPRETVAQSLLGDALDDGLAVAFGPNENPPSGRSVLATLSLAGLEPPRVMLRDTDLAAEPPVVDPGSPELPPRPGPEARYQLLGEIARGGMGAVLKGRDADLGRDLAIKVLLEKYRDQPEMTRRFVEEAQIAGQLQHPGVVPVYELGAFADRRPYFTMKLVKGRTLAALLAERSGPADDLPRFLAIFEAVCQTVAYAHARGVIHRDLKPANVMVGGFGEVQVMDWGLAKVLPRGGGTDEADRAGRETLIQTARSGSGADASRAGSVLGTPAYMPPEQARGELARVDERADVFALGAILCEVLTGRPPYEGPTASALRRAAAAELAEALARLDGCGADAELVGLATSCLAPAVEARPRDAGAVASAVSSYRAGVEARLRAAELARVEAQARADSERKRRRATVGLAASILALVVLGGGAGAWYFQQRRDRQLRVNLAFDEVERLRDLAARDPDGDVAKWLAARDSLRHVADLIAGLADARARARARFDVLARDLAAATAAAEADRKLVDELDDIRTASEYSQWHQIDTDYARAFRAAGLDPDHQGPESVGTSIARRPRGVALSMASALDDWARIRGGLRRPLTEWKHLWTAARAADPDPWRCGLRDALERTDIAALRRLADGTDLDRQPAASLVLLGRNLNTNGEPARAVAVLNLAARVHPADFWAHEAFGVRVHQVDFPAHEARGELRRGDQPPQYEEELRHLTAALALRPNSSGAHNNLGTVLGALGRHAEEVAELKEALRLRPDFPEAHNNLGIALNALGRYAEAVVEHKEAVRLRPGFPEAHYNLGIALEDVGLPAEAVAEYQQAVRLRPDYPMAHNNLGRMLLTLARYAEAESELKEAVRLQPEHPFAHNSLGVAQRAQGKAEEAIKAFKEALRHWPEYPEAHCNLGLVYQTQGRYAEALAEMRTGHELGTKRPGWRAPSAQWVQQAERLVALEERLPAVLKGDDKPKDVAEQIDFATMAATKGQPAAATRLYEAAFASRPGLVDDLAAAHRYNAACAAALAGCGKGKDDPPPDDSTRGRLRAKALDWLRADLDHWRRRPAAETPRVVQTLNHWKADADLAGVRDAEALAKLPEEERPAWKALWAEVDAALQAVEPAARP
jgi:serine/threonine-protein kinase